MDERPDDCASVDASDTGMLGAWDIDNEWCDGCCGTGELDCYCGGDLCVCSNNGTYPCPEC